MSNVVTIQQIQDVLGKEAVKTLVERFSGKRFNIPKHWDEMFLDKMIRNKNIRLDYNIGSEVCDLIKKYKLSRSTIYNILSENRTPK